MKKVLCAVICAMFAISCSNEACVKHASVEPDSLPTQPVSDLLFRSGEEECFGYYTELDTPTDFEYAIRCYVQLDGIRYNVPKYIYQLLDLYYLPENVRMQFHGRVEGDSIVFTSARQCARY